MFQVIYQAENLSEKEGTRLIFKEILSAECDVTWRDDGRVGYVPRNRAKEDVWCPK